MQSGGKEPHSQTPSSIASAVEKTSPELRKWINGAQELQVLLYAGAAPRLQKYPMWLQLCSGGENSLEINNEVQSN